MFGITADLLIIIASSLAAAVSFALFAFPFLQRSDKKQHVKEVVERKKKELFITAKEEVTNRGKNNQSAKESVATFFKVKQMAGDMGDKVRIQLIRAGIRDQKAPLIYMMAQIILPVFLALFCIFIMAAAEKEFTRSATAIVILCAAAAGFFLPRIMIKNAAIKRQEDLGITFPDALDMMLICVQGGIGLEQTVERIAEEISEHSPILAEELGFLSAEMAMLNDRRAALADFGERVGGFGKSFATALIQAEQYGTSVSLAIRVIADELRDIRMAKAEQKAASLPPKLTVPMILFFLPALFIIILGPAGIQATAAGLGSGG